MSLTILNNEEENIASNSAQCSEESRHANRHEKFEYLKNMIDYYVEIFSMRVY